jgi:hypothetical protein
MWTFTWSRSSIPKPIPSSAQHSKGSKESLNGDESFPRALNLGQDLGTVAFHLRRSVGGRRQGAPGEEQGGGGEEEVEGAVEEEAGEEQAHPG